MGTFFVDESIHDRRGGFILAAVVYATEDLTARVDAALAAADLLPGKDEFKSSSRMAASPKRAALRAEMKRVLGQTRVGLVIVPAEERPRLGNHVLEGLKKILTANGLTGETHDAYLDREISFAERSADIISFESLVPCRIHDEQDSVLIRGIQLADLAAHTMAMMLLDALGLVTKTIRLEQDGGYPAGTEIDLGFEMWTVVRTRFFTLDEMRTVDNSLPAKLWRTSRLRAGLARANWRLEDEISSRLFKRRLTEYHAHTLRVGEYALHVAEECPPDLKKAAHNRFDTSFMGCIF